MMPPFDPDQKPERLGIDPVKSQASDTSEVRYVMASEASGEDRMTLGDKMAILAGIGCAQLIRFVIIFGAIGILILAVYVVTHI
jgi:hypothetical protein